MKRSFSIEVGDVGVRRATKLDFTQDKKIVLLFSEGHARRVVREYVAFFNHSRPHQGLDQQIPDPPSIPPLAESERQQIIGLPLLRGLHHDYRWAA